MTGMSVVLASLLIHFQTHSDTIPDGSSQGVPCVESNHFVCVCLGLFLERLDFSHRLLNRLDRLSGDLAALAPRLRLLDRLGSGRRTVPLFSRSGLFVLCADVELVEPLLEVGEEFRLLVEICLERGPGSGLGTGLLAVA